MPDIKPFRGLLYNPEQIKDIAGVVTEPYDVISPTQQQAYYQAHPNNVIRLILGQRYPQDNQDENQYTRARDYFLKWQRENVLLRDTKESIYIYTQTFPYERSRKTRTGFIALLKLEDFAKNAVLPHENTFSHAVQDRLKLMTVCQANFSPIFALFCDSQRKINRLLNRHRIKRRPYLDINKEQIRHKIWRLNDQRQIQTIKQLLKKQQIFIADGHHRYEAALNYRIQMQAKQKSVGKTAPFNYVMTYLVPTNNPGLTILPTHRVIKLDQAQDVAGFIHSLSEAFELTKFSASEELFVYLRQGKRKEYLFGVYLGQGRFYGLKLKKDALGASSAEKNSESKTLDVAILHNQIIHGILGLDSAREGIYYTRDAQEAIKLVNESSYQIALFLRPTTVNQVRETACAGKKMPHKSTYFYPKLLTGLVINKL